ncbi:MAG: xylulokinase [Chloroflexota bacterium]
MSDVFIGIDVSTTASKAVAIDAAGAVLATSSHEHPFFTPEPMWVEQNPDDWWQTTIQALKGVFQTVNAADVKAIGLTGQMLGLVALDEHGTPVRPSILWNDQRSGKQCDEITDTIGAEKLWQLTGSLMIPGMTVPKLLWMREHEPDSYAKVRHVLLPKDYVRYRLSGELVTDVSDGSGTGLMDVGARDWSDEMLAALEIPREWLPGVVESPEICATVTDEAAAATGLTAGTPIVGGAGDQPAGAVGMGIVGAGATSLTVGTSGVLFTASDRYSPDPQGRGHSWCHAVPGQWCLMGVMQSAAGSLQWLRTMLEATSSYDDMNAAVADVPIGSLGLLFAPYLTGERHPHPDPLARGAFVGLTLRSEQPQLMRATMEGVAFGLSDLVELARAQGIQPSSARVSGGAANSPVWRQIMADVMGFPLYSVNAGEGGAYGAAILASVGGGAHTDVASACEAMIEAGDRTSPGEAERARYEQLYAIFRKLYPTLKDVYADLADFEAS